MVLTSRSDSGVPLYQQIRDRLRRQITSGTVVPGMRLPSSRQLAKDMNVSRITVMNAYAELEAEALVETRAGSGIFVSSPQNWAVAKLAESVVDIQEVSVWQKQLPGRASPARDQMLREAMRSPDDRSFLCFAGTRGDVRLFPTREFGRTLAQVLHDDGPISLDYESGEGYLPLREALARYLKHYGLQAEPDNILITAGAQQAIQLVSQALLQPGDRVVVESPTYPGALVAFESRGANVIGVSMDTEGMRLNELEHAIVQQRPSLIYTIPTFQNPTGIVMSATRRSQVAWLANQHGVPVLEDDYMREVRFWNPIPPPLAVWDKCGDVIYVGSFSKSLLPALRLGFVIARGPILECLVTLKRASDICSSGLVQRVLCRYLESGALHRHWKHISRVYRRRQSVMISALRRHFPDGANWKAVEGGLTLWVKVPQRSIVKLFDDSKRFGVTFAVGEAFFPKPAAQPFMRLNFAALDEQQIERGISLLGELLTKEATRR